MDEIQFPIEVRADDSLASPGRLVGTLLTYGERAGDRAEIFEPGSLTWPDGSDGNPAGVVLRRQHNRGEPIMRVVPIERDGAVVLDTQLPETRAARDAAAEIRSGLFRGLSVEFRAALQTYAGGVRRIKRAALTGAGLVDEGSYRGSTVEMRQRGGELRRGTGGRLWL